MDGSKIASCSGAMFKCAPLETEGKNNMMKNLWSFLSFIAGTIHVHTVDREIFVVTRK